MTSAAPIGSAEWMAACCRAPGCDSLRPARQEFCYYHWTETPRDVRRRGMAAMVAYWTARGDV